MVGVSLTCGVMLPRMADLVTVLRAAALNPEVRVLVGGPPFLGGVARAPDVGADTVAEDGRSAVRIAEALLVPKP